LIPINTASGRSCYQFKHLTFRGGELAGGSVIHVVEDDQPMRDSVVELLEDAGYTVRTYARAEALLERWAALEPGCIVSDVRMPGMDGITLLRRLRAHGSQVPLMLITGHGDVSMAVRAMKAGAVDFLEKPFEADVLLSAVSAAVNGGSRAVGTDDVEIARRQMLNLTSRERQVLEHLVAGKSNKEIAALLHISPRTVEFHRAHIMGKMATKGLPDLVRLWLASQTPESTK
jgi:two-component system, LuxR family, response regulator FixJ